MVIDTSAIVAAIANEHDGLLYRKTMKLAPLRLISAVTVLETRIVLSSRLGPDAIVTFDTLMDRAGFVVEPFDGQLASDAYEAYSKFGKGRGHPAQLNIIDCAAYALAKTRNLPLLFKGNDFSKTDIRAAMILDK